MSKITRQTFVQFGVNVNAAADICEFGTPATGSPVYTTTIATLQANAAWSSGWAAETISSNRPFLEDMNAVCYVFSYMLAYLFEMGIPEYDAGTTYFTNSIVQYSGTIYTSLTDNNLANTPTVGANWKLTVPPISGLVGTSVAKSIGVVYGPTTTDGYVNASAGTTTNTGACSMTCNIGATSSPATTITQFISNSNNSTYPFAALGFFVPKGFYYEVTVSNMPNNQIMYFTPTSN